MNTNALHNLLNLIGLIIAVVVGFDWGGLGLSPAVSTLIVTWALFADKIVKLAINILRDGLGGLWKWQPPVQ